MNIHFTKPALISTLIITLLIRIAYLEVIYEMAKLNCTFPEEHSFCNWKTTNENFTWNFRKFPVGMQTGSYIYTHSADSDPHEINLISPSVKPSGTPKCLSFFYYMFGYRVNQLNLYLHTTTSLNRPLFSELQWQRKGSQDNLWRVGYRTVFKDDRNYTLNFVVEQSKRLEESGGTVAIGNIQFTEGACSIPDEHSDTVCDFEENDSCKWPAINNINWIRSTGKREKTPSIDHTTGTKHGYFLIKPRNEDVAILSIPDLKSVDIGRCLRFAYYLDKISSARLNILIKVDGKSPLLLRSLTGIKNNQWASTQVYFTSDATHQILLEASTGADSSDVIAIDDLRVDEDPCDEPPLCTFQNDFCDWQNRIIDKDNDILWLRSTSVGAEVDVYPLPEYDATLTDAGYFLFVPVTFAKEGSKATLESIAINYHSCFQFYYYTSGREFGQLQILAHDLSGERVIWENKQETNQWRNETIKIDSMTQQYQIFVRVIAGKGSGYAAIDNLMLLENKDGICTYEPYLPTTGSTLPTKFITKEEITTSTAITKKSTTRTVTNTITETSTRKTSTLTSQHSEVTTSAVVQQTTTTLHGNASTSQISATHSTTSSGFCGKGKWRCGLSDDCVYFIYRCDGYEDCLNGEDEIDCGSIKSKCPYEIGVDGFVCENEQGHTPDDRNKSAYEHSCIFKTQLCDKEPNDCSDNSDEAYAVCNGYPDNYCLNGGIPTKINGLFWICRCSGKADHYYGSRCQHDKLSQQQETTVVIDHGALIWVIIPSFLVVIIAILVINLYCRRKYAWYNAAGLFRARHTRLYDRNSMDRNGDEERATEREGRESGRRRSADEPISVLGSPLEEYRNQNFLNTITLDKYGNIVNITAHPR